MKTFKDLKHKEGFWGDGCTQAKMFFDNGYGVSVIRGLSSYGGSDGLFELAILEGDEVNWNICYHTHITDDVIGYLKPRGVTKYMKEVQSL